MKRILLILSLALTLALSLIVFAPSVDAASTDNHVEIIWNGATYGVDVTGCSTWRDYLNTSDAHFHGHSVDAYGYVIYYLDLVDVSFFICDEAGNNVKADDPIKNIPYTFNCALFTFGNDIVLYKHNIMNSCFFDLVVSELTPNDFLEEDDGSISYIGPNYERFAVYDPSGNRVDTNDDVLPIQYNLKLNYSFSVQHYEDGAPSGDEFAFHASVTDWSLGSLAHDSIKFINTGFGTCFISKYDEYYAFCVDEDADGVSDKAYFLMTSDGILVRYENSELQAANYYLVDPCVYKCHIFGDWCLVTPSTCTEPGIEGRYCQVCGLYESCGVSVLGHDFDWLGRCTRDGCNEARKLTSTVGGWFSDLGGWFSDAGESVVDAVGDLIDKGQDALEDGKNAVGDKASSFFTTIAIVAGLSIGIPIAILIGRFIKLLRKPKTISMDKSDYNLLKRISSDIKKLNKRVKLK